MDLQRTVRPTFGYLIIAGMVLIFFGVYYVSMKANNTANSLLSKTSEEYVATHKGAILVTTEGNIEIKFLPDQAPLTVKNFISLTESGYFNSLKFHRVIKDFIIQTGDPATRGDDRSSYGRGNPGYFIKDEITEEKMTRGVVAMANVGPDTNGSQFFVLLSREAPWLQGEHTIFAKVTKGIEVADKIGNVRVDEEKIPVKPVELIGVSLF